MRSFFQSMRGRIFLLLTTGIVASAAITLVLNHHQQEEMLSRGHAQHVSAQIGYLVQTLDAAPPEERLAILRSVRSIDMRADIPSAHEIPGPRDDIALPPPPAQPQGADDILLGALQERMGPNREIFVATPSPDACHDATPIPAPLLRRRPLCQIVQVKLTDGTPLTLTLRAPHPPRPPQPAWWALLLFVSCIGLLAWFVARMTTRPLQQLAEAANALNISGEMNLLPEHGSSEVRSSARAFNRMQQRIRDDLRERTGMLAAITHDLQTPLTRLRLRLEKVQDAELRDKLINDMNATQQMLQEGLEFARSLDTSEPLERLDLDSLLESICSDAIDGNQPVTCRGQSRAQVMARPIALRRAISNLIDNAVKYGSSAEISIERDGSGCHIRIADHGPGIPAESLEAVFTPFYRLEASRSRTTGGTGLGLTIARNIIEQHRGQLKLSNLSLPNHPGGGLEAHITLPVASPGSV